MLLPVLYKLVGHSGNSSSAMAIQELVF